MKKIEENKFDYKYDLKNHQYVDKLEFDKNDRYIVGYGNSKIYIMNLDKEKSAKEINIDLLIYEKIFHLRFISSSLGGGECLYNCYVALKRKNINQIDLFDMSQ